MFPFALIRAAVVPFSPYRLPPLLALVNSTISTMRIPTPISTQARIPSRVLFWVDSSTPDPSICGTERSMESTSGKLMVLEGSSLEDSFEETSLELSASELETDTVFPLGLLLEEAVLEFLLELLVWLPVLAGGAVEPWPWPIPPEGFSSGAEDELDGSLAWELLEDDPGSWEELPGGSGVDEVEGGSVDGVEGLELEDPCPSSLGVTLAWDA